MKRIKRIAAWMLVWAMFLTIGSNPSFAAMAEEQLVNYLVVEEPVITGAGTQTIMIGIGDGSREIETALLSYRNTGTDERFETEAKEILGDFVMFQMEFKDVSQNGAYRLDSISYTAGGQEYSASFEEMGIEASFGVNEIVENEPDDVLLTDEELEALAAETEVNIVSLDGEGKPAQGETLEEAMESAGCETYEEGMSALRKGAKDGEVDASGMSSLIVVLDPGHGGSDPGTQANGIVEKTVNLKIAQYCKAELEEYAGLTVYMTRTDDTYLSLAQRAQVAINKKANVFVSLHNNANTSAVPNGANVYYPNSNYNANCGATGQALASSIL